MIEIDGSFGEGGGAILRVSTSLSAITGKPCKIINIRSGRKQPGLKTQHLESLKTLAKICNANLKGDSLGSIEIEFHPNEIESKEIQAEIKTAGSPGLLFQNIKIPASLGENETKVHVKGGAVAGLGAPPLPYLKNVSLPIFEKFGYKAAISVKKHGFYPAGGADVDFTIFPWEEKKPVNITERGSIEFVQGVSCASKYLEKSKVAERQADAAKNYLSRFSIDCNIISKYSDSPSPGSVIMLWAKTSSGSILGGDALGERGLKSEDVGKKAAKGLYESIDSGAAIDRNLSDQLLIFMSLVKGESSFTTPILTNHAKTNMWVIKKFLDAEFEVQEKGKNVLIKCSGLK